MSDARHNFERFAPAVLASALSATFACTHAPPPSAPPRSQASEGVLTCTAHWRQAQEELVVRVRIPRGSSGRFLSWSSGLPFFREVWLVETDEFDGRKVERDGEGFEVPECIDHGCELTYRFELGKAISRLGRRHGIERAGPVLVTSPSLWLLRPSRFPRGMNFSIAVEGTPFVSSYAESDRASPHRLRGPATDMANLPLSVMGPIVVREIAVGQSQLLLVTARGWQPTDREAYSKWVDRAVLAVTKYFGRFPLRRALAYIRPGYRPGVYHGSAFGYGGGIVKISVGEDTHADQYAEDWTLTHELIHLAFPNVPRTHRWLEEGLSTYLQLLIRAREGMITEDEFWRTLMWGLPHGLPGPEDGGFDQDTSWGELYWGGAFYYLVADLALIEQSNGDTTLQDVLRAILESGGDIRTRWSLTRIFETAQRASGHGVLQQLYAEMGARAHDRDLRDLFARLGVSLSEGRVHYDAEAPWADYRRALMSR